MKRITLILTGIIVSLNVGAQINETVLGYFYPAGQEMITRDSSDSTFILGITYNASDTTLIQERYYEDGLTKKYYEKLIIADNSIGIEIEQDDSDTVATKRVFYPFLKLPKKNGYEEWTITHRERDFIFKAKRVTISLNIRGIKQDKEAIEVEMVIISGNADAVPVIIRQYWVKKLGLSIATTASSDNTTDMVCSYLSNILDNTDFEIKPEFRM